MSISEAFPGVSNSMVERKNGDTQKASIFETFPGFSEIPEKYIISDKKKASIFETFPGFSEISSEYLIPESKNQTAPVATTTNPVALIENFCACEYQLIFEIAKLFWHEDIPAKVLGFLMVEYGVRKTFSFGIEHHSLVKLFIDKLNRNILKTYKFEVTHGIISKSPIDMNQSIEEILDQPNRITDGKTQNTKTYIQLACRYNNDVEQVVYFESAPDTESDYAKLEQKQKRFNDFTKATNIDSEFTFTLNKYKNLEYHNREIMNLFQNLNSENATTTEEEIMNYIWNHKSELMAFLLTNTGYLDPTDSEPLQYLADRARYKKEFSEGFKDFTLDFWKQLISVHDIYN